MTLQHLPQHTPRYRPLRRLFAWVALCLVLLAAATPARAADIWQYVGAAGFSANKVNGTLLVLDSNDRPYVLYRDSSNGKATVMRLQLDGSGWELVGGGAASTGLTLFWSMALDTNDRPYVAHQDGTKATVMRLDDVGTGWEVVGTAQFSVGAAEDISLALNSNNRPYVAYSDVGLSGKATVKRLNDAGTGWEPVGSAVSAGSATGVVLALDSTDRPYVAYADGTNSSKATVVRLNDVGTLWEAVGGAGFSAGDAGFISMVLNSANQPYVAYTDYPANGRARVWRLKSDESGWERVGSSGGVITYAAPSYPSLALDSTDRPYVAYRDGANGIGKASVVRLDDAGTGWELAGSAGFTSNDIFTTSVALDAHNRPYIAFGDTGNGFKATVMQLRSTPSAPAAPTVAVGSGQVTVKLAGFYQ